MFWKDVFYFTIFLNTFRLHVVDFEEFDGNQTKKLMDVAVSEQLNHASILYSRSEKDEIEQKNYRSGTSSLQFLKEDYITHHYGVVFVSFNPYFATYNEVQMGLESNGFMAKWRSDEKLRTRKPEEMEPQVLTLDHLRFGFVACLIAGVVSLVAFTGELAWSRLLPLFSKFCHETFMKQLKINSNYKFDHSQEATADSPAEGDEQNALQEVIVEVFPGHHNRLYDFSFAEEIKSHEAPENVTSSKMDKKKSDFKLYHKNDDNTDNIDDLIQISTSNEPRVAEEIKLLEITENVIAPKMDKKKSEVKFYHKNDGNTDNIDDLIQSSTSNEPRVAEEIELLEITENVIAQRMDKKKSEVKFYQRKDDDTDSIDELIQNLTSNALTT